MTQPPTKRPIAYGGIIADFSVLVFVCGRNFKLLRGKRAWLIQRFARSVFPISQGAIRFGALAREF
jgi:hypothetical protein